MTAVPVVKVQAAAPLPERFDPSVEDVVGIVDAQLRRGFWLAQIAAVLGVENAPAGRSGVLVASATVSATT